MINRALLLVPRLDSTDADAADDGSDDAQPGDETMLALPNGTAGLIAAEWYLFAPPPGSFAARLLVLQRNHPRVYVSRHVVLAVGKVATALLGLVVLVRFLLQPVPDWITDRLPDIDPPSIPWPDIPWPDSRGSISICPSWQCLLGYG